MKYNEKLKALREDNDLNQTELGKLFNVNQITISQYKRGKRQPPIEILIKYAQYFHISLDYIVGLTDNPKPYWTVKNDNSNNNNKTVNIRQNGNKNSVGDINL